ncbi:diguanylate cyclase [Cognatishimia sp. 1_MG-2023]|uniref:diguanylate cyclase n=1 Tax=Cognatishimia sp. 1_MG-2023 TaxID=3062642 RepID=UPI0026E30E7C|nr:diguanylate cyclase [Cognatishimia sp. 1_MG-2023]MDO6726358.1 diguanylate cyclase [Cognatishimia sp. 1_MG-2023]
MPGKLLIVDSIATNRIVLKVRLSTAFYEVYQASNALEARKVMADTMPDLVLLNGQLSDCDPLKFCSGLRSNPSTAHLPIVILSAKADRAHRVEALKAGANDVMARPLDDLVLLARLRSLLRSHETAEEYKLRERTNQALGFAEATAPFQKPAKVLLATPDSQTGVRWKAHLRAMMPYQIAAQPLGDTLRAMAQEPVPDVFVIAVDEARPEIALRLLAEIRARATTRHSGILVILPTENRSLLVDALDLGAHDVMTGGFDPEEMSLRISSLVQQKRLSDRLRDNLQNGLQAAVTDPLTGLFNRRYALPYLNRISEQAVHLKRNFVVLLADLDHFKSVNDDYGHAAGDAVLAETARRLRENLRSVDLVARIGGEEFLIALPDVSREDADLFAERLCALIRDTPMKISNLNKSIPVTMSIGATIGGGNYVKKSVETLLQEADQALYDAKIHGRDQVLFNQIHA